MACHFFQVYGSGHTVLKRSVSGQVSYPQTWMGWIKVGSTWTGADKYVAVLQAAGGGSEGLRVTLGDVSTTSNPPAPGSTYKIQGVINDFVFVDQVQSDPVEFGDWVHFAVRFHGTGFAITPTLMDIYIGGVFHASVVPTLAPNAEMAAFTVGGDSEIETSTQAITDTCLAEFGRYDYLLSAGEIAQAAAGILPRNIQQTFLVDNAPLLTAGDADENTAGGTYTVFEVGGGSITTCVDAPPLIYSDCPPCEVDAGPCGETVESACNATWPFALLQPRSVGIHPVFANIGGGAAMAGGHEEVDETAHGSWQFVYEDVPIHDRAQILAIRAMEVQLEGRAGVICIHAYDGKRAPWLTVGSPIIASADSAIAAGATSGSIKMTSGGVPLPGMFFSWEETTSGAIAGPWLYCLETVGAPSGSPPVYPVTFFPPIRTAIPDNDPLEFDHPMCRARLADDRALSMELNLLEHASLTIEFEEDKP